MKINIFPFENEIVFDELNINVLEIHNKKLFANVVNSLNKKANGLEADENIVISDEDKIINIEKDVMFIIDIFNLSINTTKYLNKLYMKINDDIINNSDVLDDLEKNIQNIQMKIREIISDYSIDVNFKDNVKISDFFKVLDIRFDENSIFNQIDKIFALMDVVEMFDLCKVLIFCNIKTYFDDEELLEIYKYAKHKKLNILLIEQKESIQSLQYEKKLIIDNEYEDYII